MEKIKISKKELDDLYEVIPEDPQTPEEIANANRADANFTFEEYTEQYDKKEVEEDAAQ